jgi:Spy/CpxP family protein refolding chaperone
MRRFKTTLAPALLALPLCAGLMTISTAANAAQHDRMHHNQSGDHGLRVGALVDSLDRISARIANSRQNGSISRSEAQSLRDETYRIRQAISRRGSDGLAQTEFRNLTVRVNNLRERLRMERIDFDNKPR